mgnify:CR=1 FL=1
MNKLLRDLTDGERTTIRVLLSSRSRGVTAKGAPYLSFVLQDKSGTMDAKYWNVPESAPELYQAGMIVDAQSQSSAAVSHQAAGYRRGNRGGPQFCAGGTAAGRSAA